LPPGRPVGMVRGAARFFWSGLRRLRGGDRASFGRGRAKRLARFAFGPSVRHGGPKRLCRTSCVARDGGAGFHRRPRSVAGPVARGGNFPGDAPPALDFQPGASPRRPDGFF
jgi:hypothetical protein